MAAAKPPRPKDSIRPSLVDSGWDDEATAMNPPPRSSEDSVTEIDTLIEDTRPASVPPPPPLRAPRPPPPAPPRAPVTHSEPPRPPMPSQPPVHVLGDALAGGFAARDDDEPAAPDLTDTADTAVMPEPIAQSGDTELMADQPPLSAPPLSAPPLSAPPISASPPISAAPSSGAAPLGSLAPVPSASAEPEIAQALAGRVRAGSLVVPLWALPAAAALLAAVVAGGIGMAIGAGIASAGGDDSPAKEPSSSVAAPAPAQPDEPGQAQSLLERAASGERAAMQSIEKKPAAERSIEESLALAAGAAAARQHELTALRKKLEKNPELADKKEVRAQLLAFARDAETARDALRTMAALPGPSGPDLLYEVWTGTPDRTPTTALAERLVFVPEVRKHASPALDVALELRSTDDCEALGRTLKTAAEHADRRSLHLIGKLLRRPGCVEREDVQEALKQARTRAAPVMK